MKPDKTKETVEKYQTVFIESPLFKSITDSIASFAKDITVIRCLALGSPTDSNYARYQLALLLQLAKHLSSPLISLYDPIFTPGDKTLFESFNLKIEREFTADSKTTLYFLPHAPIDLTESIFTKHEPHYVLGNDIVSHTDRQTETKLKEKYPMLATMVHVTKKPKVDDGGVDDGFQVVSKRTRYAWKRVQYDLESVYFNSVKVVKFKSKKNDPWVIVESHLFKSITKSIASISKDITVIRCLALGSPTGSNYARYQLALLLELAKYTSTTTISLYDPIFTPADKTLFESFDNVKVEQEFTADSKITLYFLPHAPIVLTEEIFTKHKPHYVLGNDIVSHTNSQIEKNLKDKYPMLATMVHAINKPKVDDGFEVVSKRTRHALNKVDVEYDLESMYFKSVKVKKFKSRKDDPWDYAFSDLAFIEIA
ncbi:SRR1-like protein BER1 [Spathaspora sp. JA1]|nr:SRR1-like protein BER1 [Spathaspora sp. JA1]